jgi:hypothetical protein
LKVIPLTKGYFAKVDDEDYERLVNIASWCADVSHDCHVYAATVINGKKIRMHTFLMGVRGVDHENGDGLDNQRRNLRVATPTQNGGNMRLSKLNTSGRKGVSYKGKMWYASITIKGKSKGLGYYHSIDEAAAAYDEAARQHFGEDFALTNEKMRRNAFARFVANT